MPTKFDADELDLIFDVEEFGTTVTATTWGTTFPAFFDNDYVEVDLGEYGTDGRYKAIRFKETDLDGSAAPGDLFTVDGESLKAVRPALVDSGVAMIVLEAVA